MNSIFGKPLDEVEYADIVDFADQQVEEGLNLDYKRDTSSLSKVVKTLVSFANTNGGWVIIGIDDEDDKPKLPVTGMSQANNYEQQINNSIISTVSPVVLPLYKVTHSTDSKHTIVIAYMPTSTNTPHWMNYSGKNVLFTRMADRASGKDWEKYASSHEWEMLRGKRLESRELREEIAEQMDRVAHEAHVEDEEASEDPFNISVERINILLPREIKFDEPSGTSTIRIIPEFPTAPLVSVNSLVGRLSEGSGKTVSLNPRYWPTSTPCDWGYPVKTYQQGAYISFKNDKLLRQYFFGLDVFGSLLNINPVQRSRRLDGGIIETFVEAGDITASVVGALAYAGELYKDISHDTLLKVECRLDVVKGALLFRPMMDGKLWPWREQNPPRNLLGEYHISETVNASALTDRVNINALTLRILDQVMHSFNYSYYNPDAVERLINEVMPQSLRK